MDKKYKEHTTKETLLPGITSDWHKTTVIDRQTGEKGVGRDYDKSKSIEKAYKDLREKRGH